MIFTKSKIYRYYSKPTFHDSSFNYERETDVET